MTPNEYHFLDARDFETLNVGRGTIDVFDSAGKLMGRHKLPKATTDLIRYAYQQGLNKKALF